MRSFALAHPFIALLLGLFSLGLLAAFWPVFLTLTVLAGLGYTTYQVSISHDRHALHKAAARAQLRFRGGAAARSPTVRPPIRRVRHIPARLLMDVG